MAERYSEHTVDELRKLASDRKISGRSEMNRDGLIQALNDQDRSDPNTVRAGLVESLDQQIIDLRTDIDALANRITRLELNQSGAIETNPIPQRR